MKPGLLLKDSPEPITLHHCFECTGRFYDPDEFRKHMSESHDLVYEYFEEPASTAEYFGQKHYYPAYIRKKWINKKESQGRMQALFDIPKRPTTRFFATKKQLDNMSNGLCHCGNSFKWPRRKHCSDSCAQKYQTEMFTVWDTFRFNYLRRNAWTCKSFSWGGTYDHTWKCEKCSTIMEKDSDVDVDHIIAIMFGGHPWHEDNLQILCKQCHKLKTRADRYIQKFWRDTQYYDPVFVRDDGKQSMLESFIQA